MQIKEIVFINLQVKCFRRSGSGKVKENKEMMFSQGVCYQYLIWELMGSQKSSSPGPFPFHD